MKLICKIAYLQHCDKVDVIPVQHISDELDQLLLEALVVLQPDGVEVEAERSPVAVEMALKVVPQHPGKLVWVKDVGAGGHKLATRQRLIGKWVISSVKLVDHHLPDRVRPIEWRELDHSIFDKLRRQGNEILEENLEGQFWALP